jgi:hypothetical protein
MDKKILGQNSQGEVRPKITRNPEKLWNTGRKTPWFTFSKEQNLKKF